MFYLNEDWVQSHHPNKLLSALLYTLETRSLEFYQASATMHINNERHLLNSNGTSLSVNKRTPTIIQRSPIDTEDQTWDDVHDHRSSEVEVHHKIVSISSLDPSRTSSLLLSYSILQDPRNFSHSTANVY